MTRAVMALSGGMDSTALLINLISKGHKVSCISYDYGQKHAIELERAKMNIDYLYSNGHHIDHRVVDLTSAMEIFRSALTSIDMRVPEGHYEAEQMKQTVVPNRNAIFASILYGFAISEATKSENSVIIGLGVHSGDHEIYPDCRPEFYEALQEAFALGNWGSEYVSFHLPYIMGDKQSILEDALCNSETLGLDFDTIFRNTNTSYNPDEMGRPSGKSGADIERILAFHAIGRKDPLEYPNGWEAALKHALKVSNEWAADRGDRDHEE